MKPIVNICFILLCFIVHQTHSQRKNEYFILQDSTAQQPVLATHADGGLVFLSMATSAWVFGFTGQKYLINDEQYYHSKYLRPYLQNSEDEILKTNFNRFEKARKTAKLCGGIGVGLSVIGMIAATSQIYRISGPSANNVYLVPIAIFGAGCGLMISAPIIKLRGISKLKIAINRHNSFR